MFVQLRRLAGQSVTYAFGEILRSSLAFLLLPLYTRVLTPADYGILGVVGPIYGLLSIFLGLGLQSAVTRFYFDYEPGSEGQRRYVGAIGTFLAASSLTTGALLLVAGPRLFGALTPETAFRPYIALTIVNACLSVLTIVPLALFRVREQPRTYVAFTITDFVLTTVLIVGLVAVLGQGAAGNVRAQALAALAMAVPAVVVTLRFGTPNLDRAPIRASLAFSLPLLPHLLGNWALNVSDRIVLDGIVSKTEIGIYTLGYQFGMLLNAICIALNNAWVPFFYQRASDSGQTRLVSLTITYQVMLVTWLALAVSLLAREVIEIMANPAYWSAYLVVPLVVGGYLLRYFYFFPVNGLFYAKKTLLVPFATLAAAAANIGLNLWLAPRFGIHAAAANTLVGFAVLLGIIFAVGQREFPLPYEFNRLARSLAIAGALFAIGWWAPVQTLLPRLVLKVALVSAFPLVLWATGTFNPAERRRVVQELRRLGPGGPAGEGP